MRCKICARSAKVLHECAAALPRVWRCQSAVLACKSRDFGAILVRDARKTTGKRARDRCVCAAKSAQDRRKFCTSAPQLCRAFGAAKAQFWRANRVILARFWCATRAKRPENVRAIAAFALQNLHKTGESFARVRRSFAARLVLPKRSFGVQVA